MATYKVKAVGESATKTVVSARNFKIVIDEPPSLGGSDQGPNPVEYILSALCGCMHIVGNVVAKEMGFELRGMEVEAKGSLDPAKFLGKDTTNRAGFSGIQVTLHPDTDADEATLAQWMKIIDSRCPVSDNLMHETPVTLQLG